MPNQPAAVPSASGARRWESSAIVVLQDRAKASVKGTVPSAKPSSLGMTRPPIVVVPGQPTGVPGCTSPACSAAAAVTILKVDPGG